MSTTDADLAAAMRRILDDPGLITATHLHIEDTLIEWRDLGLSEIGRANGLVVRSKDGQPSEIIRIGTREAIKMTLRYLADHLEAA
ncbi:hypothetical protein [Nocardia brasiliensis]|uniref:hypothetical protein n=1 Tax=Nocardia brasiliensis TaxID=37326 RepID=UPI002458D459|nr:hypothetical protein [Nocardia brasiliensis]